MTRHTFHNLRLGEKRFYFVPSVNLKPVQLVKITVLYIKPIVVVECTTNLLIKYPGDTDYRLSIRGEYLHDEQAWLSGMQPFRVTEEEYERKKAYYQQRINPLQHLDHIVTQNSPPLSDYLL